MSYVCGKLTSYSRNYFRYVSSRLNIHRTHGLEVCLHNVVYVVYVRTNNIFLPDLVNIFICTCTCIKIESLDLKLICFNFEMVNDWLVC